MNALYTQRILELAAHIPAIGYLDHPQARATAVSHLCGSRIQVELSLGEDGCINDFAQQVEACVLGQASASVMVRNIMGMDVEVLHEIFTQMQSMLRGDDYQFGDPWRDLEILESVKDYPNRHASIFLIFDAIDDCFQQLKEKGKC